VNHAGLDSAQRVFAAFDQPDLKAARHLRAETDITIIGEVIATVGA
jgi:hypothetical protein